MFSCAFLILLNDPNSSRLDWPDMAVLHCAATILCFWHLLTSWLTNPRSHVVRQFSGNQTSLFVPCRSTYDIATQSQQVWPNLVQEMTRLVILMEHLNPLVFVTSPSVQIWTRTRTYRRSQTYHYNHKEGVQRNAVEICIGYWGKQDWYQLTSVGAPRWTCLGLYCHTSDFCAKEQGAGRYCGTPLSKLFLDCADSVTQNAPLRRLTGRAERARHSDSSDFSRASAGQGSAVLFTGRIDCSQECTWDVCI